MEVTFTRAALKTLMRVPANSAKRIRTKIDQHAAHPASLANKVIELKGSDYRRLRVGDWRVIMDDRGTVLQILDIAPRGSVYD